MRTAILVLLLCSGCSGGAAAAAADASDNADTSTGAEASTGGDDDAGSGIVDSSFDAPETLCVLLVDDAGVTHGCAGGGKGPGDHDDGGGSADPPPPDAALDASDLGLGASCWDNSQCASGICFDYAVRGTFCTQRCWTNANCPPPANGCNGMGVCRFGDGGN
jgi:hypothetical protein